MFKGSNRKSLVIWFLVIIVTFLVLGINAHQVTSSPKAVSYTEILSIISDADSNSTDAHLTIQGNEWRLKVEDNNYTTIAPLTDKIIHNLAPLSGYILLCLPLS